MGRKILKSLRRSQEKSLDVKIEVDDGTMFQLNGGSTVFVNANEKEGASTTVGAEDESAEVSTFVTKKESEQRPFEPPKIWSEDFDSESENEIQQQGSWWSTSSPSKRREERREIIAYAARKKEERDQASDFCGVFDCGCGAHAEEPAVRELEHYYLANEPYMQEEPANSSTDDRPKHSSRDKRPTCSSRHKIPSRSSSRDKEPSLPEPEILRISAVSDSFDGATDTDTVDDDQQEGVEETVDAFWIKAARDKDLDLERKTRTKRIKKKLLLKRRKGRKPRKEKVSAAATPAECDDNATIMSTESTSTTGESTIISIKHVILDVGSIEEPDKQTEDTESKPTDHVSLAVDTTLRQVPTIEESIPEEDSPTTCSHTYESLSKDDSDDESENIVKKNVHKSKPKPPDTVLSWVFEAVDASVNLLAFPEIPKPRKRRARSGRRVRFAPDVKFNDPYDDYDFSLDYSYSDPEFSDPGSFDEEMYHTTDDEEVGDDDEEGFFDDAPTPKAASKREPVSDVPPSNSLDDDVETSESSDEPCVYDASDAILDFDDEPEVTIGTVRSEPGFEYFSRDAVDEDADTGNDVNELSSSHEALNDMQIIRDSSPSLDPSVKTNEPIPTSTTSEDEQAIAELGLDDSDADDEMVEDADDICDDRRTSYKSFEEMKSVSEEPSFVLPEETTEPSQHEDSNAHVSGRSESTKPDRPTMAIVDRGGARRSKKPLKPPAKSLNEIDCPETDQADCLKADPIVGRGCARRSKKRLKPPAKTLDDVAGLPETSQTDYGTSDVMDSVTAERNEYQNEHIQKQASANTALVERYLQNAKSEWNGKTSDLNRQDALGSNSPVYPNHVTPKTNVKTQVGGRLTSRLLLETNLDECMNDTVEKNGSRSTVADEREACTDWHPAEKKEAQPAIQDFTKKTDFSREGWPSSPSRSTEHGWGATAQSMSVADGIDSAETSVDPYTSDRFGEKNEEIVDQLETYRQRLRYGARISDKKECLQLSLQGFARTPRNTFSKWANFNNAPFQDLETAPFDEM